MDGAEALSGFRPVRGKSNEEPMMPIPSPSATIPEAAQQAFQRLSDAAVETGIAIGKFGAAIGKVGCRDKRRRWRRRRAKAFWRKTLREPVQ